MLPIRRRARRRRAARSDVAERCRKVIAELLKVPAGKVTPEAHFVRDLGMESVQSIELIAALEEEFDIEIDADRAQGNDTVGKAIAQVEETPGG